MSELLPVNDCYNAILEEIKQFSEQEAVSKNISLDGLNAKERSQVYKLFETTYDQLLQFDRQYSLNNGEKQVVLTVKKITPNEKMKITSVTIDDAIVREFRKYTKLPIPIINHQFIDYYIDCLNPYNGGRTMFSQFIKDVESHETVSRLRSRIEQVLDNIVSHIRDDPSMQTFRDNMFEEEIKFRKSSPYKTSGELYKKENQDKLFISVDINKASYNILKYYHPEVFNHLSTWEEFVLSFCGDKPIHILTSSKAIRVRTLGSVNFEKRISF
ncbi:unnamed protein product [Adineta steineri]|uniref:Uncharacterized protein n=1 Tax=Adineta steineri TaxID=433720 RepID=A0A814AAU4_9BILA|nr:unnamed protein product [Adineta steineri]CAF1217392.1 unnamed protein product [Adineta steineri]